MRRIATGVVGLGLVAGVLGGCGDEDPTGLASGVLEESFQTYEVVLDASDFLRGDTTFDRLGGIHGAPFGLVARSFEGVLFAHTLFRVTRPTDVSYVAPDSTSVTDTVFTIVGATVTVVFDSLQDATPPVDLEVLDLTESWDRGTATWELRADTTGDPVTWTTPGGSTGPVLGSGTWESGDTVRIALDSAAAAVLTDSAGAVDGGLIRSATDGTRLRIQSLAFAFDVRPETVDTIVPAGSASGQAFIVTPEPAAADGTELRVGGLPSWRSALHFRPLAGVEIPCGPDAEPGCTVPLAEVDVNLASLLLEPVPAGPRRAERPMRVEGRVLLRAPGVPVSRSALATPLGRMDDPVEPWAFMTEPPDTAEVRIPITRYVQRNADPDEQDPVLWLALVGESETGTPLFGYGAFGSLQSDVPPRMRLVVTAPTREMMR
ncbi:MAG: hypothetical protein ACLFRX_00010 [Gemmatimonadota bacterium]